MISFRATVFLLVVCAATAASSVAHPSAHAAPATYPISINPSGGFANAGSYTGGSSQSVSSDGRYVAFMSFASDLVLGDSNGHADIFVRDRQTGATELISVASNGDQSEGAFPGGWWGPLSQQPSISADGRYVAFTSIASNLATDDSPDAEDVFVHDRQTGTTELISLPANGSSPNGESLKPSISADGRYVAFASTATDLVATDSNGSTGDIFVRDRQNGTTQLISVASDGSQGNSASTAPSISADGRYVAFASLASNLVPDDTNNVGGGQDIFVHDNQTGTTERASVASDGSEASSSPAFLTSSSPSISSGGRYVAFTSTATNLVAGDTNGSQDIFVRDGQTGVTERISVSSNGSQSGGTSDAPSISADGRYVTFHSTGELATEDTNGGLDVFVRNRSAATTELVSFTSDGSQLSGVSKHPQISPNGRYVLFQNESVATPQVFMRRLPEEAGTPSSSVPFAAINSSTNAATVSFDGAASYSPDGLPLTFTWEFGDGSGGQGKTTSHTYAKSGTYQVQLTVTDNEGGSDTESLTVTVTVPEPGYGSPSEDNSPSVNSSSSNQNNYSTSEGSNSIGYSGAKNGSTTNQNQLSIGRISILSKKAKVTRRGRSTVRIACPKTAKNSCVGTLRLVAKIGRRTVKVAVKRFTARAGRRVNVKITVSKQLLRRLRKTMRLTTLAVAQSSNAAVTADSPKVKVALTLTGRPVPKKRQ